jgi:hypothetical protein
MRQAAPQLVQSLLLIDSRSHILGLLLQIHVLSQAAHYQQWSARTLAVAVELNMKAGYHLLLMTCAMVET